MQWFCARSKRPSIPAEEWSVSQRQPPSADVGDETGLRAGFWGGGFTLIELLVVLFIATLIVSLVLPAVGAGIRNWQLRRKVAEAVSQLRLARADALRTKRIHGVRIDLERDRFDRVEASALAAATAAIEAAVRQQFDSLFGGREEPVDVESFGEADGQSFSGAHYILFYPRGTSSGGSFTLRHRDGGRRLRVRVAPITGQVRVERADTDF